MTHNFKKDAARILLQTKSVLFNAREPFTYTSGKQGPVYVDCRRLISFPAERSTLMDMGAALIRQVCPAVDYIAGGETAGIPYAALLADRLNKPMIYVRKKPKEFGRKSQIEGHIERKGQSAILVEDLQTDGGSKKVFIEAMRDSGLKVDHAFVIFHYGIYEESLRNMKALNVTLQALTDWWSVLEAATEMKTFDEETLGSVQLYLENPLFWSAPRTPQTAS